MEYFSSFKDRINFLKIFLSAICLFVRDLLFCLDVIIGIKSGKNSSFLEILGNKDQCSFKTAVFYTRDKKAFFPIFELFFFLVKLSVAQRSTIGVIEEPRRDDQRISPFYYHLEPRLNHETVDL